MLFDWLVVGQVMPSNSASVVRGPKHSVKKGKAPVLSAEEARALLDAIDTRESGQRVDPPGSPSEQLDKSGEGAKKFWGTRL